MNTSPFRPFSGITPAIIGAAVLWAALVLMAYQIGSQNDPSISVCLFRRVTGYPCAACGGSHAAARLVQFDLSGAVSFNPLVTFLLLGLPMYVGWRATLGRSWRGLSGHGYRICTWLLLAFVAANWVYVLMRD